MKYNKVTRRHFLQGAGGTFLSLPFLPSLMSRGEAATLPNPKFLVLFWNGHGGVHVQNMYPILTTPSVASNLTSQSIYTNPAHVIKYGNLAGLKTTRADNLANLLTNPCGTIPGDEGKYPSDASYALGPNMNDLDAGAARVTPIIGSFVSDAMLAKMNLLCGIDMMFYYGHGCPQFGNMCNLTGKTPADADFDIVYGGKMSNVWVPTIDSVIANSANFYAGAAPVAKSVVLNPGYEHSGYVSAVNSSNGIVPNSNRPYTLGQAFQTLFGGLIGPSQSATGTFGKRGFLLNNIYADYKRVAKGAFGPGRRIGSIDRSRLEEVMDLLNGLITGINSPANSCTPPNIDPNDPTQLDSGDYASAPVDVQGVIKTLGLYNQLMTAAFACGSTQIFVMPLPGMVEQFVPAGSPNPTFTDGLTGGDIHNAYYHQGTFDTRQRYIAEAHRFFFQNCFYDLMQRLNGMTTPTGSTYLDQSLLYWTHEAGFITHWQTNQPVIMAGGAGGAIKTGRFIDYRGRQVWGGANAGTFSGYQGLPVNRLLGTVLQAFGVSPSEYELKASLFATTQGAGRVPITAAGTVPGYGHPLNSINSLTYGGSFENYWDYQLNDMSKLMPVIT